MWRCWRSCGKEENSENLAIQRISWLSRKRYHGVLLWNDAELDWLSVCTWFGTRIGRGARMRARGLVYPLFVAQTTWFGMLDVCSAKGEWVEHGVRGHEVRDSKNVQVRYGLQEEPMGHMKLLLSKGVSLIRGEVG